MTTLFPSFFLMLANATDRELVRHLEYLKAENRILRDKLPKRITVTAAERQRLVKLGKTLGDAIKDLISIVSPRTFSRWLKDDKPSQTPCRPATTGRPRIADDVRALILRLACENAWGYSRILGELKKLGIKVSRSTVVNVLKDNGVDPGPKRGVGTWHEFLTRHASTL